MELFSGYWLIEDILVFVAVFVVFLTVFMSVQSAKGPGWKRLVVLLAAPVFMAILLFVLFMVTLATGPAQFGVYLLLRMPTVASAAYIAAAVCFCAKLLVDLVLKRMRRQGPGAPAIQ